MKEFSIIIPVLNEEKRLPSLIDSLNQLDYPHDRYEVIFVDNGSTDGSAAMINATPYTYLYESKKGITFARQTGLEAAAGIYYLSTDADAIVPPQRLQTAHDLITADPDIDAFTGPTYAHDTSRLYSYRCIYLPSLLLARSAGKRIHLYGCNFGIKTDVAKQIGGFVLGDTKYGEDALISIRLAQAGKKIVFSKKFVNFISARRYKGLRALSLSRNIINYFSLRLFGKVVRDSMEQLS